LEIFSVVLKAIKCDLKTGLKPRIKRTIIFHRQPNIGNIALLGIVRIIEKKYEMASLQFAFSRYFDYNLRGVI